MVIVIQQLQFWPHLAPDWFNRPVSEVPIMPPLTGSAFQKAVLWRETGYEQAHRHGSDTEAADRLVPTVRERTVIQMAPQRSFAVLSSFRLRCIPRVGYRFKSFDHLSEN